MTNTAYVAMETQVHRGFKLKRVSSLQAMVVISEIMK